MEKSLKSNKKNIKFVATIGNIEGIFEELDVNVEQAKILENINELKKQLSELKSSFEDEKYLNSNVLEKFITNKNGKYLVLCKELNQMHNSIEHAKELFGSVNENIKVAYIRYENFGSLERIPIEEFKNSEDDSNSLKLFFINRAGINDCDISDLDGAIMLYTRKNNTKENLETVNKVLKRCSSNSVVIQFLDSIVTIGKYPNFKQILANNNDYNMDFEESESFQTVKHMRDSVYSRAVSNKLKLKLMREYEKETGENISTTTVYKGHNIGSWKRNMRQGYLNGKLNITKDMKEKFQDSGIFGDRQRRYPTNDIEKYNLILAFNEKNPGTEIKLDTIDEKGNPIGQYKAALQRSINIKESALTVEQINNLKELGYLNLSRKETEEISKKYNISNHMVNLIFKKYKDFEQFIALYKQGKAEIENIKMNKRGIILSKNGLTIEQKQRYINLIEEIFEENILNDTSKYITEEDLLSALNNLPDRRKIIISKRFGLNGENPSTFREITEFTKTSKQHARNLVIGSLKKVAKDLTIHSIEDLEKSRDELLRKIEELEEMDYDEWEKNKLDIDIDYLELTKSIKDKLRQNGYKKVWDLAGVSEIELSKIKDFGPRKIARIIDKVDDICSPLMEEKKEEEIETLKEKLIPIISRIDAYNRACEHYINEEDIFNQQQIIPASIIEEKKSSLSKKRQEKARKQKTLNDLQKEIEEQDKKTEKIKSVLGDKGIDTALDEKKKDE